MILSNAALVIFLVIKVSASLVKLAMYVVVRLSGLARLLDVQLRVLGVLELPGSGAPAPCPMVTVFQHFRADRRDERGVLERAVVGVQPG